MGVQRSGFQCLGFGAIGVTGFGVRGEGLGVLRRALGTSIQSQFLMILSIWDDTCLQNGSKKSLTTPRRTLGEPPNRLFWKIKERCSPRQKSRVGNPKVEPLLTYKSQLGPDAAAERGSRSS